ncbi:NADH dehydrogenase ubiquinone Fe-S protein 4 [Methylorubrum extorquens]|uniref:NADH dehydrogenase ubiquinone Fe-S protein 4 n=1 Tax=Methylorubrum extorquens TaxID=408 RepID=UPI001FDA0AC8|nr:NADH dehydrogenase ubiquinone Fe-S protein 4 [Methylorubrum extorquens]
MVETAGRAHADEWVLTFERETPPEIDDLMGWTGGEDTLATEVRLTFATRAEAVAYAERQGLDFVIGAAPGAADQDFASAAGRGCPGREVP